MHNNLYNMSCDLISIKTISFWCTKILTKILIALPLDLILRFSRNFNLTVMITVTCFAFFNDCIVTVLIWNPFRFPLHLIFFFIKYKSSFLYLLHLKFIIIMDVDGEEASVKKGEVSKIELSNTVGSTHNKAQG